MSRNEDYGYAVARIRAMEPLLFDASQYQRMLDADGLDAALKILSETTYGRDMKGDGDAVAYDKVLEAELLATYKELQSFVPDKRLIDIFRVPYDFHNVKVLLKSGFNARQGGKKRWDLLTNLGTISPDDLILNIESEDFALLPYGLSQIVPACISVWDQTKDIVDIERMLDAGLFAAMLSLAESAGNPGVSAWIRARIDAENIRNLLRLKRFDFEQAAARAFLHEGGTIAPANLIALLPEPFETWGRVLSYADIGQSLTHVLDDGDFDTLIVALEKTLDDYCQSILDRARYSSNAPENVPAYLWGKEMEVKNLRTILVSKSTDSDKEETRRLLRHGYA